MQQNLPKISGGFFYVKTVREITHLSSGSAYFRYNGIVKSFN